MNNFDIISLLPLLLGAAVLLIVLLIILNRILVNVGAREIAIKERRYFGAKMPPGIPLRYETMLAASFSTG